LQNRHLGGFLALEDPADINADETLGIDKIWTVTHQPAGIDAGVHEHAGVVAAVADAVEARHAVSPQHTASPTMMQGRERRRASGSTMSGN
jgi:hypothetical protein